MQDKRIDENTIDCKSIPEIKKDITYIKETVKEIKEKLK
jgi:hypothetical protein